VRKHADVNISDHLYIKDPEMVEVCVVTERCDHIVIDMSIGLT
jgi:hypothetical protein